MHNIITENFIYNVFKRILKENEENEIELKEEDEQLLKNKLFQEIQNLFASHNLLRDKPGTSKSIYSTQYAKIFSSLINKPQGRENDLTFLKVANKEMLTKILQEIQSSNNVDVDFNKFKEEITKINEAEDEKNQILDQIIAANETTIFDDNLLNTIKRSDVIVLYKKLIQFIVNSAVNISLKYKGLLVLEGQKDTLEVFFKEENIIKTAEGKIDLSTININISSFCKKLFQEQTVKKIVNGTESPETIRIGEKLYEEFQKILASHDIISNDYSKLNINNNTSGSTHKTIIYQLYGYAVVCFFDNIFNIIRKEVAVHEKFINNLTIDPKVSYKKIIEIGGELSNDTAIGDMKINDINDTEIFIKKLNVNAFNLISNQEFTKLGRNIFNKLLGLPETQEETNQKTTNENKDLLYLTPSKITKANLTFKPFGAFENNKQKYVFIAQNLLQGKAQGNLSNISFNLGTELSETFKTRVWSFSKSLFEESRNSLSLLSLLDKSDQFNQLKLSFFEYLADSNELGGVIQNYMSKRKQKVFILDLETVKYIYLSILQKTLRLETVQNEIFLEARKVDDTITQEECIKKYLNGISVNGNAYKSFDDIFKVQEEVQEENSQ